MKWYHRGGIEFLLFLVLNLPFVQPCSWKYLRFVECSTHACSRMESGRSPKIEKIPKKFALATPWHTVQWAMIQWRYRANCCIQCDVYELESFDSRWAITDRATFSGLSTSQVNLIVNGFAVSASVAQRYSIKQLYKWYLFFYRSHYDHPYKDAKFRMSVLACTEHFRIAVTRII